MKYLSKYNEAWFSKNKKTIEPKKEVEKTTLEKLEGPLKSRLETDLKNVIDGEISCEITKPKSSNGSISSISGTLYISLEYKNIGTIHIFIYDVIRFNSNQLDYRISYLENEESGEYTHLSDINGFIGDFVSALTRSISNFKMVKDIERKHKEFHDSINMDEVRDLFIHLGDKIGKYHVEKFTQDNYSKTTGYKITFPDRYFFSLRMKDIEYTIIDNRMKPILDELVEIEEKLSKLYNLNRSLSYCLISNRLSIIISTF